MAKGKKNSVDIVGHQIYIHHTNGQTKHTQLKQPGDDDDDEVYTICCGCCLLLMLLIDNN